MLCYKHVCILRNPFILLSKVVCRWLFCHFNNSSFFEMFEVNAKFKEGFCLKRKHTPKALCKSERLSMMILQCG